MRLLATVIVLSTLAGCAVRTNAPAAVGASASPRTSEALAGHWQGTVWEVGPAYTQGNKRLDLRIDERGAWRGTVGAQPASGVIRRQDDQVLIVGAPEPSGGPADSVYYRLVGDADQLWGATAATFSGRPANALVSLERVS